MLRSPEELERLRLYVDACIAMARVDGEISLTLEYHTMSWKADKAVQLVDAILEAQARKIRRMTGGDA